MVMLAIGAFITVVLVRPWDATAPESAPVSLTTPLPPLTAPVSPSPPPANQVTLERWRQELPLAVDDRLTWGIRAIITAPAGEPGITEVWQRLDPSVPLVLETGGTPVLAIGVTSPRGAVLDVRVWRVWEERYHFIPTESVALAAGSTASLILPPPDRAGDRVWPPGSYRVDVLLGANVVRADVQLSGEPVPVRRVPGSGPLLSNEDLARTLAATGGGALAISLSSAGTSTIRCMDGAPGPALDGAAAWTEADHARSARAGGGCSGAPTPRLPHVLALLLLDGQRITRAALVRLEPEVEQPRPAAILEVPRASMRGRSGTTRLALFRAGMGAQWEPGTYRIDAEWRDPDGDHSGSWLLSVYPAPVAGGLDDVVGLSPHRP